MKRISVFLAVPLLLCTPLAQAQSTSTTQPAAASSSTGEAAPLMFWNRPITVFRAYINQQSPAERAANARARLAELPATAPEWRITTTEATVGPYHGAMFSVNEQYAFAILTNDLDHESNETLQTAVDRASAQLRLALEARAQQHRPRLVIVGIGLSIVATIVLLFGLWFLVLATRRLKAQLDHGALDHPRRIAVAGVQLHSAFQHISRALTSLTSWAFAAVLVYLWLTFVLLRFPYTQPWGQQLGAFLLSVLTTLGVGILNSIPGMFTVIVIFVLTRIVVRVVSGVFNQVEKGDLTLPWLHPDTARATRYLVVVLVWIFAIVFAYPFVPGSSTDAFKGVSVLLGVIISLGSAGLVNQIMSGLVVIYSRALKPGEFVQVGDDFGIVTDIGMLSTKLLTRKKEEITIPHAVLVSAKTVNYSRHAAGGQAQIGTMVTIGYDAAWRQVHELLLTAASRTNGVRKDPSPRVWQHALSNFYVEYELVVNLDHPEQRLAVLSELHMHIQDAFNDAGVQIMSPAFESQPEKKVLVPRSQWFPNPTEPATDPNGTQQAPIK